MTRVEDMMQKMMRFDASDENVKEMRGDLANMHLELQMAQLSRL